MLSKALVSRSKLNKLIQWQSVQFASCVQIYNNHINQMNPYGTSVFACPVLQHIGQRPEYWTRLSSTSRSSQYAASTYKDRFGSWRKALEEFVAFVNQEQNDIVSYEGEVKNHRITKRTKGDPSLSLRFLVLERDNFCCVSCGRSPATVAGLVLEIDHIFPWLKGGETIEENLQSLCFDCNRGKGASC